MSEACNPRVGVGVLLTDNHGRVLLTLRKLPPEAGCWSIVGGKVDFLESLEQCAIREEVGVEISLRSLLCVTDHCLPGENQHWVSPAYLGQILSGEATNCEPRKARSPLVRPRCVTAEPHHDCRQRNKRMYLPTFQPFWAQDVERGWFILNAAERPRPPML
jgi:8-oxo-dGTP diphosphatase